ncbi:fasciclin domain-containing protein [Sphingobacterium sp. UBA1498]|uniref:fasciclin domain-containing protein n=1 Tax=Sphingobacterium sp. UBA1498 TaxID=1947481 RepID=UPI0025D92C3F|nr:fasciclin domain-containing protein [Sphingobacterium sp. UBA1498]
MLSSKFNLFWIALLTTIVSCRKEAFDAYYGRPDWLASPIYQQLDSMGDFKTYLSCIELSGYKNTLGTAGSWTVFAPTDQAFDQFMQENGISNVSKIDAQLAEKIVRSSMIYDGERLEKLNDYFSAKGWQQGFAFRRRSVYYDFVEKEDVGNGKIRRFISTNRGPNIAYAISDNNNKHISYFFKDYMSQRGLGAMDYQSFYPTSVYTGLNIGAAQIDPKRSNISAENGYIHVVDKVLVADKSIDQYLRDNKSYSAFKSILDFFSTYTYNAEITRKNEVLTGEKDSVFVKSYTGIGLAVNNENYAKEDPNDAQTNNISITVPNNEAVSNYAKRVLLKYYPQGTTLKDLFYTNPTVLTEFVNSHLYNTQVWPSQFAQAQNFVGEFSKVTTANIKEMKMLSNGTFYGTDACQAANVFHSVYGNVLLDPKYSFMRRALERMSMNLTLKIPTIRYMLILVSDKKLYEMGFDYDSYNTSDPIRFNGGNGTPEMREVLMSHIIPLGNDPIPDLSGNGILESYAGEYVKFSQMKMSSSGTMDIESGPQQIPVDSINIGNQLSGPLNGVAVYLNGGLTSSNTNIGFFLKKLGADQAASPFNSFYKYLTANALYSATDGVIKGVELGLNYTMLIPNNAAIASAVANGDLPSSIAPTAQADIDKVTRFIQYHITRNSFAIDGKKTGYFQSLCKNVEGDAQSMQVSVNQINKLQVVDNLNRTIDADVDQSNQLGQRVLIHSLKGYLKHGL